MVSRRRSRSVAPVRKHLHFCAPGDRRALETERGPNGSQRRLTRARMAVAIEHAETFQCQYLKKGSAPNTVLTALPLLMADFPQTRLRPGLPCSTSKRA